MDSPIADRRLELARVFAAGHPRPTAAQLRFSLGTSAAELRVPFHLTPDVARIVGGSGRQLALMLLSRHRDLLRPDEADAVLLSEDVGALPPAAPTLSPGSGGTEGRAVSFLAFRAHPALTGGVMAAWLGAGGGGRSLVALVIELLRKAFAEQKASRGRERTPALVLAMLLKALPAAEARVREVSFPRSIERPMRAATSVGLYLAFRLGVDRALRDAQAAPEEVARVEALLTPMSFLGSRSNFLSSGATLFGLELTAGLPQFDLAAGLVTTAKSNDAATAAFAQTLGRDEALTKRIEAAVATAHLREGLLHLVLLGEQRQLNPDITQLLRDLSMRPMRVVELLANEKHRKELGQQLERLSVERNDATRGALAQLGAALRGFKEKAPLASVQVSRASALADYAKASLAAVADLFLERAAQPLLTMLEPRTGNEVEGGLEPEYAAGRLYRLGVGPAPILSPTRGVEQGHLFVDVKDFTRRTSLLGQVAIADFLRREFYLPILNAAKSHYGGMSHLEDKGGITLNNLLGDALSLSGGIESLVLLARDIRRQLVSYELQLQRALSSQVVAQAVRAIEDEFQRRRAEASTPELLAKLEEERAAALSRARGEGLEAGVFVSFGPAPLVITLEDEIFGRSRVAIADRINESARGTARSGGARARADAMLSAERARRQSPSLQHPWSVFVGAPFSISVPVEAEEAARTFLRAQQPEAAVGALELTLKQALHALSRAEERPNDIYNAGAALSEEALLAYQEAVAGRKTSKTLELDPATLAPEIRQRYFFAPAPIRLTVFFEANRTVAEIFRHVGKVMFKGLEKGGGIHVWELVSEAGIGELLVRHHAASWWKG